MTPPKELVGEVFNRQLNNSIEYKLSKQLKLELEAALRELGLGNE